ncbi:MAG: hypothetical protein MZU91_00555 [Desulfosudis oleivorans]|nr:hypothetical protein [Desulfosudis oleivorans]
MYGYSAPTLYPRESSPSPLPCEGLGVADKDRRLHVDLMVEHMPEVRHDDRFIRPHGGPDDSTGVSRASVAREDIAPIEM